MERFVPGRRQTLSGPMAAYRQTLPEQVLTTYVDLLSGPGALVVSPFSQSDTLARVASAMGRRSVSAHANPLSALLARVEALPPSPDEIDILFTRVADAPHHSITTREHILDLYRSRCPECGRPHSVDCFIWEREQNSPISKRYNCPSCGATGETQVDETDLEAAAGYQTKGLAYWRALYRLANRDEPTYPRARALLNLYTGRNLYALLQLTSRLEAGAGGDNSRDAWAAILLECLDLGTSLDSPTRHRRMARLGPPAQFVEWNVWKLFERACENARRRAGRPAIEFTASIRSPLERTTITCSNATHLARALPQGEVDLIISVPPTPGPAPWVLSFMWTAWLFGKEEAADLSHWLKRYATDWNWYVEVLALTMTNLSRLLTPEGHLVFVLQTDQERWVESLLIAVGQAGLALSGLACQPAIGTDASPAAEYRMVMTPGHRGAFHVTTALDDPQMLGERVRQAGKEAALTLIAQRGEPTPGPYVHAGAYRRLVDQRLLLPGPAIRQQPSLVQFVEREIWEDALGSAGITPLEDAGDESDTAPPARPGLKPELWWITTPPGDVVPLTDRVEEFISRFLSESQTLSTREICDAVYQQFSGLSTPLEEVVTTCLMSYARQDDAGIWRLRPEDMPARRQAEMREMLQYLQELGERLGLQVAIGESFRLPSELQEQYPEFLSLRSNDVLWMPADGRPYLFRVIGDTSSCHLDCDSALAALSPHNHLVLPGGRSSLVALRLRVNPLWRRAVERQEWRFVKYRHIRRLLHDEEIDLSGLLAIVGLDPIVERSEAQMPLL